MLKTHLTVFCSSRTFTFSFCRVSSPDSSSPLSLPFLPAPRPAAVTSCCGRRYGYVHPAAACVMGLYVTLISGPRHGAPAAPSPGRAAAPARTGGVGGGAGSSCPLLPGTGTEPAPGARGRDPYWPSRVSSLGTRSFGRLRDFFSRIICGKEDVVRRNTATPHRNTTCNPREARASNCHVFHRIGKKRHFKMNLGLERK